MKHLKELTVYFVIVVSIYLIIFKETSVYAEHGEQEAIAYMNMLLETSRYTAYVTYNEVYDNSISNGKEGIEAYIEASKEAYSVLEKSIINLRNYDPRLPEKEFTIEMWHGLADIIEQEVIRLEKLAGTIEGVVDYRITEKIQYVKVFGEDIRDHVKSLEDLYYKPKVMEDSLLNRYKRILQRY